MAVIRNIRKGKSKLHKPKTGGRTYADVECHKLAIRITQMFIA